MKTKLWILVLLLPGSLLWAQQKRPPAAGAGAAAKICADPYAAGETTEGWPEAPVLILFHREKSKAPWARNPAIKLPGLEAASAGQARTVVCVEESLLEAGHYDSGEAAYSPSWDVTLVRVADGKVYFMRGGFYGKEPPQMKFHRGAGVGARPVEEFTQWLRLVVDQKVARRKLRLRTKEYGDIKLLAFSGDGRRLVVGQEARSTSENAPITVFDLETGQVVAALHAGYYLSAVALSRTGEWLAVDRNGHPEVWEVPSGRVAQKLDTYGAPVAFAPDDTLGVADRSELSVWDIHSGQRLRSAQGSALLLSPAGAWLVASKSASGVTLAEMGSGRTLASFPPVGGQDKFAISGDGKVLVSNALTSATLYAAGAAEPHFLRLPNQGVGLFYAMAPTPDGVALANSDGFVGMVSAAAPEPRVFATEHSAIKVLAVSRDGKLLALADSSGGISVWELR